MPKKPKPRLKVVETKRPPPDHNEAAVLTTEQRAALFHNHLRIYREGLRLKERSAAEFRNKCKMIKAEGTQLADIKTAIKLSGEEGEKVVKAEIEDMIRIARWMGCSVGYQMDMFEDRRPDVDRAYDNGKVAGLSGEVKKPPYTEPAMAERWMEGWSDGQAALIMKLKAPKPPKQKKAKPPEAEAPPAAE